MSKGNNGTAKAKKAKKATVDHPTKVLVDNRLLKPVIIHTTVEDPKTLESTPVKVQFWPGKFEMDKAEVKAALALDWTAEFVKKERDDELADVSDVFIVKPVKVPKEDITGGE